MVDCHGPKPELKKKFSLLLDDARMAGKIMLGEEVQGRVPEREQWLLIRALGIMGLYRFGNCAGLGYHVLVLDYLRWAAVITVQ